MAINTGAAELRDGDYFGAPLNRVSRLLAAGHGGQILVASSARDLLPETINLEYLGLHRLRDIPNLEHIYQVVYSELPTGIPPLRTVTDVVHNLPQQLTAFVGRDAEIAEWTDYIRERSRRLFTVTGFGGVGKSRLAMRLGEELAADFADGVWWCGLEQAGTAEEALTRIAQALGITLQSSPSVAEQICRHLRERNLLLILDNVEQVTGGAGFLKQLLADTRQVVCLITSRRTMELRGETVLELAPMALAESVSLFSERASECRPDFEVTADNRGDVQELCKRLEGVPLAIELAAARVAGMSPRQIFQRLNERFRLLQFRSADLNERQRALRGAIDWSYALLNDDDKQVFAQLSVFSGGFTLEDAEAVCEAFDVLESVMSLRQQSLYRAEGIPGTQEQRFVMLDTLREYAAEKLAETEDGGISVKKRHANRFLKVAQDRLAQLRTPNESRAMQELGRSEKNLRAAFEWASAGGEAKLQAELALALGSALHRRGFLMSAADILECGLLVARPISPDEPLLAAKLLLERAGLHYDFKEPEPTEALVHEAIPLLEKSKDSSAMARAENLLGQAAMYTKRHQEAIAHYTRAQELFAEAGHRTGVAIALNNTGLVLRRDTAGAEAEVAERRTASKARFQESLDIRRTLGDRRGLAETLNNLGVLSYEMKQYPEAWRYYFEALSYEREIDHRHGIALVLANLGEVAGDLGQPATGARLLLASEGVFTEVGSPLVKEVRGMLDAVAAQSGESVSEIEGLRAQVRGMTVGEACEWALAGAADIPPTV
jgi:predicted ATPase